LLTYTFANIEAGKNLEVKVSAVNLIGESTMGSSLILIPATVPSPPFNLVITAQSTGSITVEWQESERDNGASI